MVRNNKRISTSKFAEHHLGFSSAKFLIFIKFAARPGVCFYCFISLQSDEIKEGEELRADLLHLSLLRSNHRFFQSLIIHFSVYSVYSFSFFLLSFSLSPSPPVLFFPIFRNTILLGSIRTRRKVSFRSNLKPCIRVKFTFVLLLHTIYFFALKSLFSFCYGVGPYCSQIVSSISLSSILFFLIAYFLAYPVVSCSALLCLLCKG